MTDIMLRKLNLGCGFDRREGFLNIDMNDFHKPDLVEDVTSLRSLPNNYFEYILANDVLEHIARPKMKNTLIRWNEILKLNGILEIRVPDLCKLSDFLKIDDIARQKSAIQMIFGTQAYKGDFHYNGFTVSLLSHYLNEAGFGNLSFECQDGWLIHCTAEKIEDRAIDEIYKISDNETFLSQAWTIYLGAAIDETAKQHYLKLLNDITPREIIISILEEEKIEKDIHEVYGRLLKRRADAAGLFNFKNELKAGKTIREIEETILSSDEYKALKTR